jgi:6-phosphogluconolactonase (cycloisomerase 2 family)
LLGAVQFRSTQSLVFPGRTVQTVETISQDRLGALCVAQRPNPISNDQPIAQRFLLGSGGVLARSPALPTAGGQTAIARDPGRNGNYEAVAGGVRLSTESDCNGFTSIVAPVPGVTWHLLAVDPLGRHVYVMSYIDARLTVLHVNRMAAAAGVARPFGTATTVSTVTPTGLLMVSDLAIDERGERLFATVANRDQLLIMNLDANGMPVLPAQVVNTGQWPAAVAISPDNRNLYVLNATGRSISRFAAAPGFAATGTTPLPTITGLPQAASSKPRFGFEVARTGQLLYVSDYDADTVQFWGISEPDGSLTLRTSVPMPGAGRIHAVDRRF